jgi:hypothetical protein
VNKRSAERSGAWLMVTSIDVLPGRCDSHTMS